MTLEPLQTLITQCRRAGIAAVLTATSLLVVHTAPASAAASMGASCFDSGQASFRFAGFLLGTATITFSGTEKLCQSSDPTIRSGIETGTARAQYNCLITGAADSGVETISWNNGRTSVVSFTDTILGSLDYGLGTVTAGEFAGETFHFVGDSVANPLLCISSEGVVGGIYSGLTTFQGSR